MNSALGHLFHKYRWLLLVPCWLLVIEVSNAQNVLFEGSETVSQNLPSPRGALLRSFVVPGWGHNYVNSDNWTRGKIHLAADVVMIVSYFGLNVRANRLENSLQTLARSKAGVSLSGRNRDFELAIANFNSLAEYNDFQLRSRRWNEILPDTPENRWQWQGTSDRQEFQDTRDRIANSKNQLPTLLTLMVANRLLSGINAFTRARNMIQNPPEASVSYLNEFGQPGITAKVKFSF